MNNARQYTSVIKAVFPVAGAGTRFLLATKASTQKMPTVVDKSSMDHRAMVCWYAVCCKPRQEAVAEENLLRQGFHVYLPRIRIRRHRRGQWVDAIEALFPRYLFIRIDPHRCNTAPVRSTARNLAGQAPSVH